MDVVSTCGVSFSLVRTQILLLLLLLLLLLIIIIIIIIIVTTGTHFLTSTNAHSPQCNFVPERNQYCLRHDNSFHFRRAKAMVVCK